MRFRLSTLFAGGLIVAAAPMDAQLRASRPTTPTRNNPRLLVANPHSFASTDSAAAVRVGAGLRERLESVADKWFTVVPRNQMNDALVQYGYPPDAVLPPLVARQLGTQLQARALVVSTMQRGADARVTVETRLIGISDRTGFITRMAQNPNQSYEDLGQRIADALKPAFEALEHSRECDALARTNPDKAAESAAKALKAQPSFPPAEMCLAGMARTKGAGADVIGGHFRNAVAGDRQSLEAWGGLLGQYQQQGDTAQIIETYKEILRIAPTNQTVREEALKWLVAAGHPQVGEEVAREGIELDPANPELWDQLSTACLVQGTPEKNLCAIQALEQVFALDTAKADTVFFQKILFVAAQDSTQPAPYVKWAKAATTKYADRALFLGELVRAYGYAGDVDNLVAATRRLVAMDKSDMTPVIRAVRALVGAKRYDEAIEVAMLADQHGNDGDRRNAGVILAQEGGLEVLRTQPIDFPLVERIGRAAVLLVPPGTPAAGLANYVLGMGLMYQTTPKDDAVTAGKSCELITVLEQHVSEAIMALRLGRTIQPEFIDNALTSLRIYPDSRIAVLRRAYCR